jgi:hypothetical protein
LIAFFTDACKRNGIPPPAVRPCPLDVKACIFMKNANGLTRELVAVLGMNGLTFGDMKINLRGWADTFEEHLDTRRERGPVKGSSGGCCGGIV